MSATSTALAPELLPGGLPVDNPAPERHITAVPDAPGSRRRPRLTATLTALGGLGLIIVAQLVLGTALSHGAYEISALQTQERNLGWTLQDLNEDVQTISSPQNIARQAQEMGMIVDGSPAYLRLSDSAVLGVPGAATDDAAVPFGDAGMVGNSLLDAEDSAKTAPVDGSSSTATASGDVSLDDGLPTPVTR
ncbi:hypothetical protein [Mycetocola reblochoni]|uniref:Cell division protein FtsL n=2 Tax=Mycetocola reblochoni TaxID=331618 RepID=A0A1R4J6V8_9MICO|nr:hypothetical protein [Mycetocola reblochoni]RLP69631.1 hypothetical protein D9V30_06740 [Mycetocola reblochoni]SJN27797.1 Cell division protein FtsL [Mycetocola reblochoni REB411]